jgi:hypothetical protein
MNERDNNVEPKAHAGPIVVQAHPPERRRRSVIAASPSCCCCCCCLHSAGGLIGAAASSASPKGRPAAAVYWMALAVAIGLSQLVAGVMVLADSRRPDDVLGSAFGIWIAWLIFGAPVIQLAASVIAALMITLIPGRAVDDVPEYPYREGPIIALDRRQQFPDRTARFAALGWITLWTIGGTVIGIGLMWMMCMGLR